jgi:dTDP-4-amino-4,6-dideoxygalactose transaminase
MVRLTSGARLGRDELIARLSEAGIGTSVHFIPLHRHPFWRDSCALSPQQFPAAEASYQSMLTLPLYTRMTDADQQRVIDALHTLLS